jgi:hypothetical protein
LRLIGMNITTFNEPFEKAILNRHSRKIWEQWSNSPLFEHSLRIDEVIEKVYNKFGFGENVVVPFPYPLIRADLKVLFNKLQGKENPSWLPVSCFIREEENGDWEAFFRPRGLDTVQETFICNFYLEKESRDLLLDLWDNKNEKWLAESGHIEGDTEAKLELAAVQVYAIIRAFAEETMMPSAHIALVRPNRQGKSIEWIKARTHYTIIYHGHPANKKGLAERSKISEGDKKETIQRMAHNRRAHKRLLKSDRFRFKKGQEITVRATWIGPKEWMDEGGHQIYRILDPVVEKV